MAEIAVVHDCTAAVPMAVVLVDVLVGVVIVKEVSRPVKRLYSMGLGQKNVPSQMVLLNRERMVRPLEEGDLRLLLGDWETGKRMADCRTGIPRSAMLHCDREATPGHRVSGDYSASWAQDLGPVVGLLARSDVR